VACAIHATHSNVSASNTPSSTPAASKYGVPGLSTASNSMSETPRAASEMRDQFQVSDLGITTQFSPRNTHTHVSPRGMQTVSHRVTLTTPRHVSPRSVKSTSHRVKLLVDTGSCRIAMTGEVPSEDLPALNGAMRDNDDVMLIDEDSLTRSGLSGQGSVEVVSMTHDMLLSSADEMHYSNSMNEQSVQFSDV